MAKGTHNLDHLTESIANAMHHAQSITEEQHLELMDRYFETTRDEEGQTVYRPKMVQVRVPNLGADDPEAERVVDIPLITLVPVGSMLIEELKVEFRATLETVAEPGTVPPEGHRPPGWHKLGPRGPFGAPAGVGGLLGARGDEPGTYQPTPLSKKHPEAMSQGKAMVVSMSKASAKPGASNVNITITFKKGDPPEGLVRMNDVIVKQIP